jgi:hypothetical protein
MSARKNTHTLKTSKLSLARRGVRATQRFCGLHTLYAERDSRLVRQQFDRSTNAFAKGKTISWCGWRLWSRDESAVVRSSGSSGPPAAMVAGKWIACSKCDAFARQLAGHARGGATTCALVLLYIHFPKEKQNASNIKLRK